VLSSIWSGTSFLVIKKFWRLQNVLNICWAEVHFPFIPLGQMIVCCSTLPCTAMFVDCLSRNNFAFLLFVVWIPQDAKVSFTVGATKNSRIFSPRKMVSCFAMMFVPLWKFLAMNITQISGAFSLIRQKWAWRWFTPQRKQILLCSFGSRSQHERKLWKHESTVGKD